MLDQEHGLGGEDVLLQQLVALAGSACFPVVRLAWHEAARFKRALDLGACGIMVPYVDSAEQASAAAAAMRYPPHGGVRGVAKTTRATNFGAAFDEDWDHAVERLLLVDGLRLACRRDHAVDRIARDVQDAAVLRDRHRDLAAVHGQSGGLLLQAHDREVRIVALRRDDEARERGRVESELRRLRCDEVACAGGGRRGRFLDALGRVVQRDGDADLPGTVETVGLVRLGLRLGQGGQEHSGEDRDDGDHHQELDQRESAGQIRPSGRRSRGRRVHDVRWEWTEFRDQRHFNSTHRRRQCG
jgi:hypothetical protein